MAKPFDHVHSMRMVSEVAKLCVFCGVKPNEKTKEHVIPGWLMRLTGSDTREVFLGVRYSDGPDKLKIHRHSLNRYTFPACHECNQRYATLEALAKPVCEKLIEEKDVSPVELEILFHWLDKVRVGLWLAGRAVGTNIFKATDPRFHIAHRIGQADRWARLTLLPQEVGNGLTYAGVGTPLFGSMPSAFSLRINRLIIQNASSPRLISRWMGLPYPATRRTRTPSGEVLHSEIRFGKKKILPRMMNYRKRFNGLEVFQPAYPFKLKDCERPFLNEYAKRFFNNLEDLEAKVVVATNGEIHVNGSIGPAQYAEMKHSPDARFPTDFSCSTLELQNYVSREGLFGGLPVSKRDSERARKLRNDLCKLNRYLLKRLEDQAADPNKSDDGYEEMEKGLKVISI